MKRIALLLSLFSAVALADLAPMPPPEPSPEPAVAAPVAEAPAPAPAPAPLHPVGIEKAGPSGVIDGGWSYVFGAYGVGYVGIALYALSLVLRRQKTGATP